MFFLILLTNIHITSVVNTSPVARRIVTTRYTLFPLFRYNMII